MASTEAKLHEGRVWWSARLFMPDFLCFTGGQCHPSTHGNNTHILGGMEDVIWGQARGSIVLPFI